jgi:hypothetical protein
MSIHFSRPVRLNIRTNNPTMARIRKYRPCSCEPSTMNRMNTINSAIAPIQRRASLTVLRPNSEPADIHDASEDQHQQRDCSDSDWLVEPYFHGVPCESEPCVFNGIEGRYANKNRPHRRTVFGRQYPNRADRDKQESEKLANGGDTFSGHCFQWIFRMNHSSHANDRIQTC